MRKYRAQSPKQPVRIRTFMDGQLHHEVVKPMVVYPGTENSRSPKVNWNNNRVPVAVIGGEHLLLLKLTGGLEEPLPAFVPGPA